MQSAFSEELVGLEAGTSALGAGGGAEGLELSSVFLSCLRGHSVWYREQRWMDRQST